MATRSDTPVLDTLAAMTVDSIERCGLDGRTLVLTRLAALAAMDAPAISYLAHVDPALKANLTATHITEALGITIALAEAEAQAMAEAEARSRSNPSAGGEPSKRRGAPRTRPPAAVNARR